MPADRTERDPQGCRHAHRGEQGNQREHVAAADGVHDEPGEHVEHVAADAKQHVGERRILSERQQGHKAPREHAEHGHREQRVIGRACTCARTPPTIRLEDGDRQDDEGEQRTVDNGDLRGVVQLVERETEPRPDAHEQHAQGEVAQHGRTAETVDSERAGRRSLTDAREERRAFEPDQHDRPDCAQHDRNRCGIRTGLERYDEKSPVRENGSHPNQHEDHTRVRKPHKRDGEHDERPRAACGPHGEREHGQHRVVRGDRESKQAARNEQRGNERTRNAARIEGGGTQSGEQADGQEGGTVHERRQLAPDTEIRCQARIHPAVEHRSRKLHEHDRERKAHDDGRICRP